jgi:opacity protein-like surface antigen
MFKWSNLSLPALATACIFCSFGAAAAQTVSAVPASGFYVGLGGSYNSINFGTQNVYAVGTSDVYQNGVKVSSGTAAGPADLYPSNKSGFAPTVQIGYFHNFAGTPWLWGAKFTYSYIGQTSTLNRVLLPQAGAFTYTQSQETVPFTGNAVVGTYQTSISHQLALVPFIGHDFPGGFVYFGAGPTLSNVHTRLNNLVGFADINGNRTDVSGAPLSFSASSWVFGGAMAVGATYFLTPSLFMDANYTVQITATAKENYSGVFTNANGSNGSTTIGTMVGSSSGNVVTQGLSVTINQKF